MPAGFKQGVFRWLKRIGLGLVVLLLAATAFGTIYEFNARRQAHEDYPPPGQMVDIGGRRMHLDCRGDGSPTVVLESGLDTNGSLAWDRVHDELAAITRTCAYDRAGIMWSEPKSTPQHADAVAQDLQATGTGMGHSYLVLLPLRELQPFHGGGLIVDEQNDRFLGHKGKGLYNTGTGRYVTAVTKIRRATVDAAPRPHGLSAPRVRGSFAPQLLLRNFTESRRLRTATTRERGLCSIAV